MMTVLFARSGAEHVGSVSPLRGSPHEDDGLVLVADVTRGGCKELAGLFSNILNTLCLSTYANLRISPKGIQPGDPEDRRNLPCMLFDSLATAVGKISEADRCDLESRSIELCIPDAK